MELPSGPFDESFANKNEEVDEYGIETSGEGVST